MANDPQAACEIEYPLDSQEAGTHMIIRQSELMVAERPAIVLKEFEARAMSEISVAHKSVRRAIRSN
jgi:hypothetical protein